MKKFDAEDFLAKYGRYVAGSLDLEGCTGIRALPDNLTVGGSLHLRGTGITALPDNLTVGGYLDLRGTGITKEDLIKVNRDFQPVPLRWRGGQYIRVDGIFSEVVAERATSSRFAPSAKKRPLPTW